MFELLKPFMNKQTRGKTLEQQCPSCLSFKKWLSDVLVSCSAFMLPVLPVVAHHRFKSHLRVSRTNLHLMSWILNKWQIPRRLFKLTVEESLGCAIGSWSRAGARDAEKNSREREGPGTWQRAWLEGAQSSGKLIKQCISLLIKSIAKVTPNW